jgi:hypothetical protein
LQSLTDRISAPRSSQQKTVARNVKGGDEVLECLECSNSAANLYRNGKHAALPLAALGARFERLFLRHL